MRNQHYRFMFRPKLTKDNTYHYNAPKKDKDTIYLLMNEINLFKMIHVSLQIESSLFHAKSVDCNMLFEKKIVAWSYHNIAQYLCSDCLNVGILFCLFRDQLEGHWCTWSCSRYWNCGMLPNVVFDSIFLYF